MSNNNSLSSNWTFRDGSSEYKKTRSLTNHSIILLAIYWFRFLFLKAYQPLSDIQYKKILWMTIVLLFKPYLGNKGLHTFPKGISPKMNVIARLEFEFASYNVTVQHVNYYTVGTYCYSKDITCSTRRLLS